MKTYTTILASSLPDEMSARLTDVHDIMDPETDYLFTADMKVAYEIIRDDVDADEPAEEKAARKERLASITKLISYLKKHGIQIIILN